MPTSSSFMIRLGGVTDLCELAWVYEGVYMRRLGTHNRVCLSLSNSQVVKRRG
jgi:hypothetical protein